jgi:hypothetical protein
MTSQSLSRLIRKFDLREWVCALADIRMGSDREAAILATSMIDRALEFALIEKFVELTEAQKEAIFEGMGPLSSFSAKIKLAHALGVAGDQAKSDLERIRKIRNAFAHSFAPITFDTPEVSVLCARIVFPTMTKEIIPKIDEHWEIETAKGKFLMAATLFAVLFISQESSQP